ncbi:MAG: F0F1 ATP synthase subunit delta [Betaproteobacteria bacterium]|jgi:F-type H+-transporting ATPase subunit delta|nr:F0F1 ATP synthase subunit delta [Betaproteobacteria bacterium]NBT68211.1 F0F1 ATP synthase subunit delta [Betaproteobacteria bacterium]NBY08615.1 F0F1 ATP synthase subunit delta [Betaproteobacteria bacterium]
MAELATIARPYAEALFKATAGQHDATAAWLDELSVIAGDPQLLQFADSPKVTANQVFDVVSKVAKSNLPPQAVNFLHAVIDNNRISVLSQIAELFHALNNAEKGQSEAVIYSAFPMDASVLAQTKEVLEKRFGRKLNVTVELESQLIGGIRVVVGDEVLDTSVKSRLEHMKVALTT